MSCVLASAEAEEPLLWLDASNTASLTIDSRQVKVWAGAKAQQAQFRQDDPEKRPKPGAKLNDHTTLLFDGNDFLAGPPVLVEGDDTFTYIALWRAHRHGVQAIFEQAGSGTGRRASLLLVGNAYGFNGQSNDAHSLVTYKANEWRLTALVVTGAEHENVIVIDNDNEPKLGRINIATQNVGVEGVRIGNKLTANSEFFYGDLAEIRIFDSALSRDELTRQLADVRQRWGLTFTPKVPVITEVKTAAQATVTDKPMSQNFNPTPEQFEFFENQVRPLFSRHCYKCHSTQAKKVKGKLYLDSHAAAIKGGESGPALVPGNPEESLLIKAVQYQEESLEMPPNAKLTEAEIDALVKWVKMGAPWPKADREELVIEEQPYDWEKFRREHWSFKPIQKPALPSSQEFAGEKNPIDMFIFERLKKAGLKASPPASRRTLIRRAYFDLIGLPPPPEAVDTFLKDSSPGAFSNVIDELLNSPHYGERWGRHWLDVARYSDGLGGFLDNGALPQAWQFRDWVVRSLNRDMPYDEFVREQIAGDLLEKPDSKIGPGFFAVGPTYSSDGGDPEAKSQAEAETLADRVDTLSRAFLAMTVQCARCHDHKFDPITTKDYYALAGIFRNTAVVDLPLASKEVVARYNEAQIAIKAKDTKIKQWISDREQAMQDDVQRNVSGYLLGHRKFLANLKAEIPITNPEEWARKNGLVDIVFKRWHELLQKTGDELKKLPGNHWENRIYREIAPWFSLPIVDDSNSEDAQVLGEAENPADDVAVGPVIDASKSQGDNKPETPKQIALAFQKRLTDILASPENRKTNKALLDALDKICDFKGQAEKLATEEEKNEIAALKMELEALQKESPPRYPTAHGLADRGTADMHVGIRGDIRIKGEIAPRRFLQIVVGEKPVYFKKGSGRLELADAVVDKNNPLTARVMVNRIWLNHFGKALVRTPSNFGILGEKPTHPKLLDWLAATFIESGWSMKTMHKLIMTSAAWQMSSSHDETNFGIDGDNRLIWRMNPRRLDVESWRDSLLAVTGELDETLGGAPSNNILGDRRRTIYTIISRNGDKFSSDEFLRLFDFPDPRSTSARRVTSIVPQQYLFMMNSEFMLQRAKAFSEKLQKDAPDAAGWVERAYSILYNRRPSEKESEIGSAFLSAQKTGEQKIENFSQFLMSAHEFMYVE
ncbi:MAG: DUF1549 domain-containing protein [Planctomycetota bacterium]|nr:DUF1549 domain-containing protein [Planctomycetota bacterium]